MALSEPCGVSELLEEHCRQNDLSYQHSDCFFFEPVNTGGRPRRATAINPALRFRFFNNDVPIIRETLLYNGWAIGGGPGSWQLMWSGCHLRDSTFHGLLEHQKVNHFPNTQELTRKDRLWANSRPWVAEHSPEAADFLPETFVLPAQLDAFLRAFDAAAKTEGRPLWICKPNALSRGRGIFLVRNLSDLSIAENCVVSRYIANPFLIQGLKFDLRIYVLVTSYDPLRIYVYKEGLTRFASSRFSVNTPECLGNKFKHLTNYSVNKVNGNFVENNDIRADNLGHKWSLSALFKHLRACMSNAQVDAIWKNITDLICKTIFMSHKHVNTKLAKNNCFELFGFDILLDEQLKPWLLEVNLSPSLATESPLDRKVKSTLVADILNLAGIAAHANTRRHGFAAASLVSYAEDRGRKAILHGLAEVKRHYDWGNNFLPVYPTAEAVVKYRHFLTNTDSFRNTLAFNQLLFPSIALPLRVARPRKSIPKTAALPPTLVPLQRSDVHTPPADEQIHDVEL